MLHGCRCFRRIGPLVDDLTTAFPQFTRQIVEDANAKDAVVVYVDRCVIIGAAAADRVDAAVSRVAHAATRYGVRLPPATSSVNEAALLFKGFEFSVTGIVRK
jgi:hypothetical protein